MSLLVRKLNERIAALEDENSKLRLRIEELEAEVREEHAREN